MERFKVFENGLKSLTLTVNYSVSLQTFNLDLERLYSDYNIPYQTEGHKHTRPGWVNTECPFCTGNPGLHLGATLDGKIFYCWRCGVKHPEQALSKILHVNYSEVKQIIIDYAGLPTRKKKQNTTQIKMKALRMPGHILPLLPQHKSYLLSRKFDPTLLEIEWGIMSTGPISFLDGVDYSHRIIIPIYWNNRIVTFQGRDVTNKHMLKYMACPKVREAIHHKHILYKHNSLPNPIGICVEGVTDVWRFGKSAFGTFGIEYTHQQVELIASMYKQVYVCFDGGEKQAKKQADKLVSDLRFRKVHSQRIDIKGDPGDMRQEDADALVQELLTKKIK